jgi:HAD superfamily hydrolase (TIGR01509 family)
MAGVTAIAVDAVGHDAGRVSESAGVDRTEAWLVDLDGTLYWQLPVRLAMACELSIFGTRNVPMISRFRREQELLRKESQAEGCPYQTQLVRTAAALGKELECVATSIAHWMEQRPGKWLRLWRRKRLIAEIQAFREAGGKTALVSDYPARRKLQALGVEQLFDVVVACGEPGGPMRLKPSPQGYLLAAQRLAVAPERCLVLGDRDDADGEAARQAGMRFRLVG